MGDKLLKLLAALLVVCAVGLWYSSTRAATFSGSNTYIAGPNASSLTYTYITEEVTCATGATTFNSATNLLPANCYVIGVVARVTQAPATATTWKLGPTGGTSDLYAEALQPVTLGQCITTWNTGHAAGTGGPTTALSPFINTTANTMTITMALDPGATSMKLRITTLYQYLTPPGN